MLVTYRVPGDNPCKVGRKAEGGKVCRRDTGDRKSGCALVRHLARHSIAKNTILDERVLAFMRPYELTFIDVNVESDGRITEISVGHLVNGKKMETLEVNRDLKQSIRVCIRENVGRLFVAAKSERNDTLAMLYPEMPLFFLQGPVSSDVDPSEYKNPCCKHRGDDVIHCASYRMDCVLRHYSAKRRETIQTIQQILNRC